MCLLFPRLQYYLYGIHIFGEKARRGFYFWSMLFALILLRIVIQTKASTFKGALDFQVVLSKRNISMLREEVKN